MCGDHHGKTFAACRYSRSNGRWSLFRIKVYHRPLLCCKFSSQEVGQFDLYYYDGLARQEEVIRLTVGEYLQWVNTPGVT